MEYPKPFSVHFKAIVAALVPMAFALLFTWLFPVSVFSLTREDGRVDCVVEQRLLWVLPFSRLSSDDVRNIGVHREEAGGRQSDSRQPTYYLQLTDAAGNKQLTPANQTTVDDLAAQLNAFLKDSKEPSLTEWTVPLLGYAAIIPAAFSLLFLLLVVPDACRSLRYWILPPVVDDQSTTGGTT